MLIPPVYAALGENVRHLLRHELDPQANVTQIIEEHGIAVTAQRNIQSPGLKPMRHLGL